MVQTVGVTCPLCGKVSVAQVPADACQFFYDCPGCRVVLRPLPGDCCVFCSHGKQPCPSVGRGGRAGQKRAH